MLMAFVVVYLLGTIGVGLWAAKRVRTTADFAVAGRHLPLVMIITTTFATWFGSETVLGIPAKFVDGGLKSVIEDPFGSSMCLVLVGLFSGSLAALPKSGRWLGWIKKGAGVVLLGMAEYYFILMGQVM